MSYDIDVYTITNHHSSNYTSNISKMYYLAFDRVIRSLKPLFEKSWVWYSISGGDIDFKKAINSKEREVIIPTLQFMITDMKAYPEIYRPLNPENEWGNYEGAIQFLEGALKALLENENSIARISW